MTGIADQRLTVVMYHYVRPLADTPWPDIKGLDLALFREQLGYLKRHYQPIDADLLMDAVRGEAELPPRALLLTFDDGYLDHYAHVFPLLQEHGLRGCFFPPGACVDERLILTANKLHFVLASKVDPQNLIRHIDQAVETHRHALGLSDTQHYWSRHGQANRFDSAEVIYIKRMLQHALPESLREQIADELFRRHVSDDPRDFADQLYVTRAQLREMHAAGQAIGSHGYRHYWLNTLDDTAQADEIDRSLAFLQGVGVDTDRWLMCYPYGGYDARLLERLGSRGCMAGFTTAVDIADLSRDAPLTLPRLDTNDLPKAADEAPNGWTRRASAARELHPAARPA